METMNPTKEMGKNIFRGEKSIINLTVSIRVLNPSDIFKQLLPDLLFIVRGTNFTFKPSFKKARVEVVLRE